MRTEQSLWCRGQRGSHPHAGHPCLRAGADDSPVAGLKLGLTGGDGTQQKLTTSASGATTVQNNASVDSLDASYLDDN